LHGDEGHLEAAREVVGGEQHVTLSAMAAEIRPSAYIIDLKTAKALGLTVPLIMQMTADEVIE
jgi:hypothetical protein